MFLKSTVITMLVAAYSSLPNTWASSDQCVGTYSTQNRILSGHVIVKKSFLNNEGCVKLCIEHPSCHSINYYERTTICELNDRTEFSNPEDMVDSTDTIYITNSFRPLQCSCDSECGENSVCLVVKGGRKCKECNEALGLESGVIPNSAITASSYHYGHHPPVRVRLNSAPSSWAGVEGGKVGDWIQVDLGKKMAVKKVATQGRKDADQWVTSYNVASSNDGSNWETYKKEFQGNSDRNTVVSHVLKQHIVTRNVRILPRTWYEFMSLRAEFYGCSLD